MDKMLAPLIDAFKQRLTSPFLSGLAAATLVVTWQGLLKVFFGKADIGIRIERFRQEYWFGESELLFFRAWWDWLVFPAWLVTITYISILFVFFVWFVDYLNWRIDQIRLDSLTKRRAVKAKAIEAETKVIVATAKRDLAGSLVNTRNEVNAACNKIQDELADLEEKIEIASHMQMIRQISDGFGVISGSIMRSLTEEEANAVRDGIEQYRGKLEELLNQDRDRVVQVRQAIAAFGEARAEFEELIERNQI